MKSTLINKIISFIFLLFIIYLFIINFYHTNILNIIGMLISIILIYIINRKNDIKIKYLIIIGIVALLIRLFPILINNPSVNGDYGFFYNSAINYSNNTISSKLYISTFPYIFLLGNIMKIIGTKYISIIILNIIFDIIGFIFLRLLLKNKPNKNNILLLYILNPFNIIWDSICAPIIIINTLLIVCLYLFLKIEKQITKKSIILSILLGLLLSITNTFRPIIIIYLIALIMTLLLSKDSIKKLSLILITLVIYIGSNFIINNYISNKINMPLPKTKSGWSIYVGSNYESDGMWNKTDSEYLSYLEETNGVQALTILKKEGLDRYKNLKIKIIPLLIKKSIILGNDIEIYSINDYMNLTNNKYKTLYMILTLLLYIYEYLIIFLCLIKIITKINTNNYKSLSIIGLYSLGLYCSMLLVEVSPRYYLPIMLGLMLYGFIQDKNIYKKKTILFTAFNLDTGGVEKCLANLVNNLDTTKYNIKVLLQVKEGIYLNQVNKNIQIEGYKFCKIKNKLIKKIVNIFKFIHIIIKNYNKYDCSIYYATGYVPSSIVALFASRNNISWMHTNIVTYMDNYKPYKNKNISNTNKCKRFINRCLFRCFKNNVFVSYNALDAYLTIYPQDKNKCKVIYNYIDSKEIIDKSKEKISIKKDKLFTFVNIGRQTDFDKRISRIINSCTKLNKENYKYKVMLVGTGTDTNKYKEDVKKKNLENTIIFIDNQKNPYPYYLLGDVFILSSAFEGLPTTIMESLTLNIPILSTDVSDVKRIVDNKYGIVVKNEDETIYYGMKQYLDNKIKINGKFNIEQYNSTIINNVERYINHE